MSLREGMGLRPTTLLECMLAICLIPACDKPDKPSERVAPVPQDDGRRPIASADAASGADQAASSPPDPLEGMTLPELTVEPLAETHVVTAPSPFEGVVPRLSPRAPVRFANLIHEANNASMRGAIRDGVYEKDGRAIAARWRRWAQGTRGVFVLRDSLFSQQDHPTRHDPWAPMVPPNWITTAAYATEQGRPIEVPTLPEEDRDAEWAALSMEQMFGVFPPSESLYEAAVESSERARFARAHLRMVMKDAEAMRRAAPYGVDAVIDAGAARLAFRDRAYFGEELRREVIIPIFVERPTPKEIEEGKGMRPPHMEVPDALVARVTRRVYARRLQDGAIAIERYDLSSADERRRILDLLEGLIPTSQTHGETVWVWVTGPMEPGKKLVGQPPVAYMQAFFEKLEQAEIARERVAFFGKPMVRVEGETPQAQRQHLREVLKTYAMAGLEVVSINLPASSLWAILDDPSRR